MLKGAVISWPLDVERARQARAELSVQRIDEVLRSERISGAPETAPPAREAPPPEKQPKG